MSIPYPDEQAIASALQEDYRDAGRTDVDVYAGMWAARIVYDHTVGRMSLTGAIRKHRDVLRAQFGLPPLPQ